MYLALSFRFLVLEHVSGGELFDHLVKRGRLPLGEVTCLNYFCLSTSFNFYWKCNSAYFGLYYWLVRVIWLVHFAGYISLCGLLNAKVCFDCQNVSWRKIWNRPQENYTNEEIEQSSQTFELDSWSFFEEDKQQIKKDDHSRWRYSKGRQILWKDKI